MKRAYLYPCVLIILYCVWLGVFASQFSVSDLLANWASSVTMIFGSFVAGSTPLGGGAVAFPVFTKLLEFSAMDAKVFSLAIQAVGMSCATLFFVSRGVTIYWSLLLRIMPFALLGLAIGLHFNVANTNLKVIYSFFLLGSGYLLVKSMNEQDGLWRGSTGLYIVALLGGVLSSFVGAGADTLLFFYLVLRQRVSAKALIPTTVCFMALISLCGIASLTISGAFSPEHAVFEPWFFAAPIVAVGAPLGGYILAIVHERVVMRFIYLLIALEVVSTLLIIDFAPMIKALLAGLIVFVVFSLLRSRKQLSS
ncbi:sulfite exporter TauE/SafE family protein [Pseudoalteromonas sp. SSDWG2]|uniref:sulfite exporter TauE/SafE family protein n=1 Tax=Pseudoalteromonas sp. SSDWG2 TaxID=3139391 RepID=UPI003BAC62DB